MSLRIERSSITDGTRIRLSGEVRSDRLAEVRAEIARSEPPVTVDLEELDHVDAEAIRFLNACEALGVELANCSSFIREWMLQEREREKNPEGA